VAKATIENPRVLLNYVLNLIARDIKSIYTLSEAGKLDHEVANDLVRYSGALLAIIKDMDSDLEKSKKKIATLSKAELAEKARSALKLFEDSIEQNSKP